MSGLEFSGPVTLGLLAAKYRRSLLEDIIPFWLRHARDPSGALNTWRQFRSMIALLRRHD